MRHFAPTFLDVNAYLTYMDRYEMFYKLNVYLEIQQCEHPLMKIVKIYIPNNATLGRACGSVGRAVASDTRYAVQIQSLAKFILNIYFLVYYQLN